MWTMRSSPRHARSRSAVQVAGRSGGDASEAIVTAMKGPRRGTTKASALVAAVLATVLAGCGQQTSSATRTRPAHRIGRLDEQHRFGRYARSLDDGPDARPAQLRCRPAEQKRGLAYSTASAQIVQPQPASGSCHAIGAGLYSRPDPRCTPGALNPAVTQADIRQTICQEGWTDTDTAARERHRARESREHGRLRRRRADQLLRV